MGAEPQIHRLLPTVMCSGCRVRMASVVVDSLPADRIDVTYRCDKCGAETQRMIKARGS